MESLNIIPDTLNTSTLFHSVVIDDKTIDITTVDILDIYKKLRLIQESDLDQEGLF